jgi:hypothetical protein
MSSLIRIWEKVTGTPPRQENAEMVSQAADNLAKNTEELSAMMKPYLEAEDPLVMLLTDIFNQRQLGSKNAKPELHS